jgi:hypothetical protein
MDVTFSKATLRDDVTVSTTVYSLETCFGFRTSYTLCSIDLATERC